MKIEATTPEQYIEQLPDDRKEVVSKLRKVILENLSEGFAEEMSYGMIGYVVPKSIYPEGYRSNHELPLPFINLASQKNHIAIYHFGLYAHQNLMDWFLQEYPKHIKTKLDMGKSCLRFKKPEQIPFELIGELAGKMTVEEWIKIYEKNLKR
ncbi:DUF1801 domain-containing protein [Mariniphaga sp.]|uniref:DUF1801 domain-containing protein n=1 Tax=Mariniphaga sp. TaxID=1954475 RepID=UPI0035667F44